MLDEKLESLFRTWLAEHGAAVLKVARAYTLTVEDRQDLVQEILFQVWRSLPSHQGRAAAPTWAYRVALNTALGWRRGERRRRARQRPIPEVENLPAPGLDGPQRAVQAEIIERLYAAIRQLPGTDAALALLHLEGLSHRQIAEVLGISENNVGVKLHRAKKALSRLMKEEPHEP